MIYCLLITYASHLLHVQLITPPISLEVTLFSFFTFVVLGVVS